MSIFNKNARVCFVGDSITAANKYVSLIAAYYKENLPELNVQIYNCGVSGGTAKSQYIFFNDDVLPHNPTDIFIMLGINDSDRGLLNEPAGQERYEKLEKRFEEFKINYKRLYEKAVETGATVTVVTPPPYAEYQQTGAEALKGGYALMAEYANIVRKFAKENNCECIDVHKKVTYAMQGENFFVDDRIHPNDMGHYHIAKTILEFQGIKSGFLKEIPEYLKEWRTKDNIIREIYASELMIMPDYAMPIEEKMRFIKSYVEEKKWLELKSSQAFFERISKIYAEYKPKQQMIFEEANRLVEKSFR